jgi:NADH-quinone oxidoreductase subunit H
MISYEIPLILSALSVLMVVGSLSLTDVAQAQSGGIHTWFIFTPWGFWDAFYF